MEQHSLAVSEGTALVRTTECEWNESIPHCKCTDTNVHRPAFSPGPSSLRHIRFSFTSLSLMFLVKLSMTAAIIPLEYQNTKTRVASLTRRYYVLFFILFALKIRRIRYGLCVVLCLDEDLN